MKLINFGSLNIDYVYEMPHFVRPGETLASTAMATNCGGKGLNQSIAAAQAGLTVLHAGFIGSEGVFLKERLEKAGVDTRFVRKVSDSTGHAIIEVDPEGQNSIILYQGANYAFTKEYVDEVLSTAEEGDLVLLQNETSCVEYIIEKAASLGLRVALNAAPSGENLKTAPLEKLSYLIINETEGEYLSGCADANAMMGVLQMKYPNTCIVLTLGAAGSRAADRYGEVCFSSFKVPVIDTTAAGDTFIGYFLKAVEQNMELLESLRMASAASALAIGKKGAADSVPAVDEVNAFLKAH